MGRSSRPLPLREICRRKSADLRMQRHQSRCTVVPRLNIYSTLVQQLMVTTIIIYRRKVVGRGIFCGPQDKLNAFCLFFVLSIKDWSKFLGDSGDFFLRDFWVSSSMISVVWPFKKGLKSFEKKCIEIFKSSYIQVFRSPSCNSILFFAATAIFSILEHAWVSNRKRATALAT